MKSVNFLSLFGKKPEKRGFSEFFLYASDVEKKKVIRKAAMRANKDQKDLFDRVALKKS